MGSHLGPNYACLFMGHVEEQIFAQYTGTKPALYKIYIDDIVGATSGSRDEIEDFATYVNGFHPSLQNRRISGASAIHERAREARERARSARPEKIRL